MISSIITSEVHYFTRGGFLVYLFYHSSSHIYIMSANMGAAFSSFMRILLQQIFSLWVNKASFGSDLDPISIFQYAYINV